jgi:hypothetical protein
MAHWQDTMVDRPEVNDAGYVAGWTSHAGGDLGSLGACDIERTPNQRTKGVYGNARQRYGVNRPRRTPRTFSKCTITSMY